MSNKLIVLISSEIVASRVIHLKVCWLRNACVLAELRRSWTSLTGGTVNHLSVGGPFILQLLEFEAWSWTPLDAKVTT